MARSKVAKTASKLPKAASGLVQNPVLAAIVTDIALRSGGRLIRNGLAKTILKPTIGAAQAKAAVGKRSMAEALIGTAVARVATKSLPGALMVGGGLLAKALWDRRKGREATAKGATLLAKRAAKDDPVI